ncbi:HAD hydrolase family protein [Candidatus Roizmanbacteria bacterium]|nr:HAD hydrolase family protein [Candidatus Roizmanbacteria bacterium]
MEYKLLLVDFDGTLTTDLGMPPIEYIPSPHLFNVVREGLKHILLSCGLRIAMGNAVQELKDIAHYIVPDVKHDGVAYVIEKFVLKKQV